MHMIDALVSPVVGGTMWAGSVVACGYGVKKIKEETFSEKKLPIMAVSGAFVFAAQMINFTIPGTGSSGHIGGGILLAALLGEFPALITLAAVLLIQCLFFADGGLLAYGANVFNMGVIPCLIIFPLVFKPIVKNIMNSKRITIGAILSSVLGLQLGAFAVVIETLMSGITELPFVTFVSLMQPIHLAIGLGEGLATAAVLVFVHQMRPEIMDASVNRVKVKTGVSFKKVTVILAILALLIGGGLSFYASAYPDGLEWSMGKIIDEGEPQAEGSAYETAEKVQESTAFMPDYDFKEGTDGAESGLGTGVAGLIGATITAMAALIAGGAIVLVKKRKKVTI